MFAALLASFLLIYPYIQPGWFDAAELSASASLLGVSHPPGQPLYMMAGNLFSLIPFGSIAFRTSIFSSVSMVLATVGLSKLFLQQFNTLWPTASQKPLAFFTLVVAVVPVFHISLALQSTRTEIYAFQLALIPIILFVSLKAATHGDARWFFLSSFFLGLAFGSHVLLTVPLLITLAIPPISHFRRRVPLYLMGLTFFALGIFLYFYLPLRASAQPLLNWHDPISWQSFLRTILARDYQRSFHLPNHFSHSWAFFHNDLLKILPISFLALFGVGLCVLFMHRKFRPLLLLACPVISFLSVWLLLDFQIKNPDFHGYMASAILLVFVPAGIGAYALCNRMIRKNWLATTCASILLIISILIPAPSAMPAFASHGGRTAEELSRILDLSPPEACFRFSSDHWVFPFWYRTLIEKRRPDTVVIAKGLLPASWYQSKINQRLHASLVQVPPTEEGDVREEYSFFTSSLVSQCKESFSNDPFQIQESICSHIVLALSRTWARQKQAFRSIALLENWLGCTPSQSHCTGPSKTQLPFPLYREFDRPFIANPDQIKSELMLLYMGCHEEKRAKAFVRQHSQDVDTLLLYSFLLWNHDLKETALTFLKNQAPLDRAHLGLIRLALATLYFLNQNPKEGWEYFTQASMMLGATHPAISHVMKKLVPLHSSP